MIQIHHNNFDNIVRIHNAAIYPNSIGRIKFCIAFFEAVSVINKIEDSVTNIENEYGINALTANAFVRSYVKNKKNKKKVNQNSILNLLKRKDTSLVSIASRKREFKSIIQALNFITKSLSEILKTTPDNFAKINTDFKTTYRPEYDRAIKKVLEFILPYETLIGNGFDIDKGKWDNYSLTKSIGLQTCPYCNRSWINTVTDGDTKQNVINPQLDHFYCKDNYPLFRLSFFNLIPSCEACNTRLKRITKFDKTYLNPYVEGYGEDGKFRTIAEDVSSSIGLNSNYKVILNTPFEDINKEKAERIKKNHSLFEVNRIYESHGEIISEIYRKSYISENQYLSLLKKQFPALSADKAELYRIGLGNFYNESDFNKRPFAKLTKDVAEQLGLID